MVRSRRLVLLAKDAIAGRLRLLSAEVNRLGDVRNRLGLLHVGISLRLDAPLLDIRLVFLLCERVRLVLLRLLQLHFRLRLQRLLSWRVLQRLEVLRAVLRLSDGVPRCVISGLLRRFLYLLQRVFRISLLNVAGVHQPDGEEGPELLHEREEEDRRVENLPKAVKSSKRKPPELREPLNYQNPVDYQRAHVLAVWNPLALVSTAFGEH